MVVPREAKKVDSERQGFYCDGDRPTWQTTDRTEQRLPVASNELLGLQTADPPPDSWLIVLCQRPQAMCPMKAKRNRVDVEVAAIVAAASVGPPFRLIFRTIDTCLMIDISHNAKFLFHLPAQAVSCTPTGFWA